jgi:large subunit ribosomal protein L13
MKRETHTIDATGKVLGRLAAKIAILLRGKHKPDFVPYKDMGDFVIVENVEKLKITGRKMEQKKYFTHSEYLGGWKEIPLKNFFKKGHPLGPAEVLKKAVFGMLPKNKLRTKMIKRLKIHGDNN